MSIVGAMLIAAAILAVCSQAVPGAGAASPGLLLTPASPSAGSVALPEGSSSTVVVGATPIVAVPKGTTVTFRVTHDGKVIDNSPPEGFTQGLVDKGLSATYSYSDTAGAGTDTVTATATSNGQTVASGTTTIAWMPPLACTDIGLPKLFRSLHCTSVLSFVANAYDTAGCVAEVSTMGRLSNAILAAESGKEAVQVAAGNTNLAKLATALAALRRDGVGLKRIAAAVYHATSFGEAIKNIIDLVGVATKVNGHDPTLGDIAAAIAKAAGFGSCVSLIQNSSAAAAAPPAPKTYSVSLDTLCQSEGVELDARDGCPYDHSATIASKQFPYSILVLSNDDSVTPVYWDLVDFPSTTCTSITFTFGMPSDGSKPGDTASIEVVSQSGAKQSQSVGYGNTATFTASLDGHPWSLENSASNAADEIAIRATATCASPSGY